MSLNRRQFLKNAGIGSAALVGGASLLKSGSAFACYPAPTTSYLSFIGATYVGGTPTGSTPTPFSYTGSNGTTGRRGLVYDVMKAFDSSSQPLSAAITAAISAGKTIVLKANCSGTGASNTYSATGSSTQVNSTHVDALLGAIDYIRSVNATVPIVVAEAGGGNTGQLFGINNYGIITGSPNNLTGITFVDLNNNYTLTGLTTTSPYYTKGATSTYAAAKSYLWKSDLKSSIAVTVSPIWLSKNYFIISICRAKVHNCEVITGVTKNCAMGMPLISSSAWQSANSKTLMHVVDSSVSGNVANEDRDLAWNIFQNTTQYTLCGHPDFAVLDAWEGEQGQGPVAGTPIQTGCAVAGYDHLAVDRITAKLVGLSDTAVMNQTAPPTTPSYTDARTLVWMSNAGIGNYDLGKISFVNSGTTLSTITPYIGGYYLKSASSTAWTAASAYTMNTLYTGSPYWMTQWLNDSVKVPDSSADSSVYTFPPLPAAVLHGAKPCMSIQANQHMDAIARGNDIHIDLFLPASAPVRLGIFNLKGQEVKHLATEYLANGRYAIDWNCRDDAGSQVPNGSYLIKLTTDRHEMCDKVTLIR